MFADAKNHMSDNLFYFLDSGTSRRRWLGDKKRAGPDGRSPVFPPWRGSAYVCGFMEFLAPDVCRVLWNSEFPGGCAGG